MDAAGLICISPFVAGVAGYVYFIFTHHPPRARVYEWAEKQGLTVVSLESGEKFSNEDYAYRVMLRRWSSPAGPTVYNAVFRDPERRTCQARVWFEGWTTIKCVFDTEWTPEVYRRQPSDPF